MFVINRQGIGKGSYILNCFIFTLFLYPTVSNLGYYSSLRKLAVLSVGVCVMCLWCVSLYGPWNSMSFLCIFHVVAIELEFWNFAHAFLASIPICMHGFIMIRILLLPFAYVLKILKLFLYSFRFKELGARTSTRR